MARSSALDASFATLGRHARRVFFFVWDETKLVVKYPGFLCELLVIGHFAGLTKIRPFFGILWTIFSRLLVLANPHLVFLKENQGVFMGVF